MGVRVGINGFGRIGRAVLRAAYELDADVEVVGINDLFAGEALANVLARDSVYGEFPGDVSFAGGSLRVDGVQIPVLAESNPARLPWAELGAEVVLECTGKFRTRAEAASHLEAGAQTVIVSAPMKDADTTVVLGVNFPDAYRPGEHAVISNASCTTNCLAPVAKVLHETVGIRHGLMTTIHAYTGDQRLVDTPHKDARRARAAGLNLVPTSTGAAKAIGLVIPELAGKLHGFAVRAPIPTGSLVDLTVETEHATSVDEVNGLFRARASDLLDYSEAPIVSSDVVKSPFSAIVDAPLTTVLDGTQVKVVAWYDNEWGYSLRLVELAQQVLAGVPA